LIADAVERRVFDRGLPATQRWAVFVGDDVIHHFLPDALREFRVGFLVHVLVHTACCDLVAKVAGPLSDYMAPLRLESVASIGAQHQTGPLTDVQKVRQLKRYRVSVHSRCYAPESREKMERQQNIS